AYMLATCRTTNATRRRGQNRTENVASLRQSPPNAIAAAMPATTPLASMGIADDRLASQPTAKLRQGLVVDRRQVADLERFRPALLQQLLEGANDDRVELDALVLVELLHRLLVAD